jgi:hypothetical protein
MSGLNHAPARRFKAIALLPVLVCMFLLPCPAQTVDGLLDKLVSKGILTVQEANELRDQADQKSAPATEQKSLMPAWVTDLEFSGDLRGRFDGIYAENDAFTQRERWRYRARVGFTMTLLEAFEIGMRLGSGEVGSLRSSGIDPISNNQDLENNASKKGIFIDRVYGTWMPLRGEDATLNLTIGKMQNPFVFSDMIFDPDYTPEGAAVQVGYKLADHHEIKLNGGAFVIDELSASRSDPYLFGGQLRLDSTWNEFLATSTGVALLGLTSPEQLVSTAVPNMNAGNTRDRSGALVYDYYPVIADASVIFTLESFPLYPGAFPIRVGGDYVHNNGAPRSADNYAWSLSVNLGRAEKRRSWELEYTYKWLGANAWYEEMTDSDFGAYWSDAPAFAADDPLDPDENVPDYNSGTNARGHIVRASYSPYDFLTFSATWFYTELINPGFMLSQPPGNTTTHRVFLDAMIRF